MAKSHAQSEYNLLTCLSFITAYHGHARSAASLEQSLTSGSADGVGAETIIEAAQFAGFTAEILTKDRLADINAQLFPVIILTGQGTGLVLLDYKGATARIFEPLKHKEIDVDAADLERAFQGKIIVFKRDQNSIRAASLPKEDQPKLSKSWFWDYFKDNMPIYRLVGIAALLINFFALTSPIFIMNMYDRVIPNAAIETGWALAIGALIVFSFDLLIRILRGRFIDLAGRRMDVLIGTRIFDQLLNIKLSERPQSSGVFASMLKEFDAVRDFFTSATIASLVDLPFALFFVAVIFFIAGPIACIPNI